MTDAPDPTSVPPELTPPAPRPGGPPPGAPPRFTSASPVRDDRATRTRSDDENWAPVRERFTTDGSMGRDAAAVDGRRISGPIQGFGKLWQKTYRTAFAGVEVTPEEVVARWRERYGDFWPTGNEFRSPLAGVAPGEIALISGKVGGLRLSTGVLVLYADETSFSFITPEGHMFAGLITFSADRDADGVTNAQVQLFIRAQDPMVEIGLALGGSKKEDRLWAHAITALASSFGVVDPQVDRTTVCVDRHRQWRRVGNLRHDAALAAVARVFRRR